jgi:lariat debranching enzyme
MKVAVEGCCHGELDAIYNSLQRLEQEKSEKVDLLIIGGDFQAKPIYSELTFSLFVTMQIWHV